MQPLEQFDVAQIVNLVGRAGDPTVDMPLADRKRMLLEGVAELVAADIWFWSSAVTNDAERGDSMATWLIDGGYRDEQERAAWYRFLADPQGARPVMATTEGAILREEFTTFTRRDLVSDRDWPHAGNRYRAVGFGDCIISMYPVGERVVSGVGLHRRLGRPEFTDRDRAVVHIVFQQVDWLHRHGSNVPAGKKVLHLSPRERQVLVFLLGGDSLKEVAHKLTLSEHTVANYVKEIYKCFSVNSRAELLSHFISGGQRSA